MLFIRYMEVGIDEAGRGSFLGRIYAGAVIMGEGNDEWIEGLNDSKKLSKKKREELYEMIIRNVFDYGVGYVEPWDIDKMGIGRANQLAMRRALDNLSAEVGYIKVDGIVFNGWNNVDYVCIPKGDTKEKDIMCGSIIAKVEHDRYINDLDGSLDVYDIKNNMGYGTLKHRNAIKQYGITKYHRKSFLNDYKCGFIDD